MINGRFLSIRTSRIITTRNGFFGKKKKSGEKFETSIGLTDKEEGALRSRFPNIVSNVDRTSKKLSKTIDITKEDSVLFSEKEYDSIRARGILPFKYVYNPPSNLKDIVVNAVSSTMTTKEDDFNKIDLSNNLKDKAALLIKLGKDLSHSIPNSKLHEIKTVADVYNFYLEPINNTTEYVNMARDSTIPNNVFMREEPFRFHPDDVEAYHGGVTAFPGEGGEVYGLRNKRIHRQFNPRKEWFDYEEISYDYKKPDADLPWDPRIAEKMDRYFSHKKRKKVVAAVNEFKNAQETYKRLKKQEEDEKERKRKEMEERREKMEEYKNIKKDMNSALRKRNKKGQPNLGAQVEVLLKKIERKNQK
uniref:Large ribosomal subunit protein mL50 n=1 Tax=Strongyloides stercoralis TaxID=6248 RepID=A0AAF5CXY4_STRER